MAFDIANLNDLGWNSFFSGQLDPDEQTTTIPVKVIEVHRGKNRVVAPEIDTLIDAFAEPSPDGEKTATVGDWLLIDPDTSTPLRLLERTSLFKRRAPGTDRKVQLIAANIDVLFIVTSCNQDFNVARLERYLALAIETRVTPVLVLTKADSADDLDFFTSEAAKLLPDLIIEVVDARSRDSAVRLTDWCARGQTVALVGSSGVGKSTLINTLTGEDQILTQGIREDDSKGRHTTTGRTFHRLPGGGWLLDTPGMRGLELAQAGTGLDGVFGDIAELAQTCRFKDCAHDTEPGCGVQAAVQSGALDAKRLKRWQKLIAEENHNKATLAERHVRDRAFGKKIKKALAAKNR